MEPLNRSAPIFIAGHRGLVGSAILRLFEKEGFTNIITRTSQELDLRDEAATHHFFQETKPNSVILAAAKVGGIMANSNSSFTFLMDNLSIQNSVMKAALAQRVNRLLFLGSSCIYPKLAPQPIKEEYLLTGPLEASNENYAVAKIAGLMTVKAVRKEYGLPWISAMPTNLYGPNDNYDPETSHVLAAFIRRFHEAKVKGFRSVTCWGTGSPRREFLHVDDLARACLLILDSYDAQMHINIGAGEDISIKDLADLVADVIGYQGSIEWDSSKPDGTPRKLLDVQRLGNIGFKPNALLGAGIERTYRGYLSTLP
jgi:GDP-L-fucose synthase